jgi:hypothetical protein
VLIEQGHHRQLDQAKLSALKLLPKYRRTIIERMMVLRSVLLCAMMATVGAFTQSPAAFVIPKGELMTSSSVLPLTFLATGKKGYQQHRSMTGLKMSYVADSSDYGSDGESEYEDDAVEKKDELKEGPGYREFQDTPTQEEQPVPMSKNAQKRFLIYYYDKDVDVHASVDGDDDGRSAWEGHDLRERLMEQHVLWARTANLYNETFNQNSMADVVWSYPL